MKNVKLIKTKTAIIILVILIILVMFAVFLNVEKFYQKEYENFPTISVYYKDKIIGTMLPTSYNWTYNGETKEYNIKKVYSYDFPEENIILMGINNTEDYYVKTDIRYKTQVSSRGIRNLVKGGGNGGTNGCDISREFQKGKRIDPVSEIGEYLYTEKIQYLKQGNVVYNAKVITFDESQAKMAKNYLNISINDNKKIDELLNKMTFNTLYNSCKIEGKNLIMEYDYHISTDALKMNNLILFTCIPELETVTYSPKHKKTIVTEIKNEAVFSEKDEVDKYVYTKEEVNNQDLANIENLKKFMEQI